MLIKPQIKNTSSHSTYYFYQRIDKKEMNDFISQLKIEKLNIQNKILFLMDKTISQNKLREAGFKITRDKNKADLIVIKEFSSTLKDNDILNYGFKCQSDVSYIIEKIDIIYNDRSKNYSYIYEKDIYKFLYKYEGNKELFDNISELFKSNSSDNFKIAMEFMCNANWKNNEIYLMELFNLYYNVEMNNPYKNSISFKGFLNSLDFNYKNVYFHNASDYRDYCKTDEHHDFVYNKFKEEFKEELENLIRQHKIKIDKLEFSIDKSIINKYEDD